MSIYCYQKKWNQRAYLGPDGEKRARLEKIHLASRDVQPRQVGKARGEVRRPMQAGGKRVPRTLAQKETAAERRRYRIEARAYIAARVRTQTCPVFMEWTKLPAEVREFLTVPWSGKPRSAKLNEVHHTHGRIGGLLNYQPWWMPVSKWGHRAIHAFPKIAREFGWLCPAGEWNQQPK